MTELTLEEAQDLVAALYYVKEECLVCLHSVARAKSLEEPGVFGYGCEGCGGTGKVRRWPMRMGCPGRWTRALGTIGGESGDLVFSQCQAPKYDADCHGKGYVPVRDMGKLMGEVPAYYQWKGDEVYCAFVSESVLAPGATSRAVTPELALWLATLEYLERRERCDD